MQSEKGRRGHRGREMETRQSLAERNEIDEAAVDPDDRIDLGVARAANEGVQVEWGALGVASPACGASGLDGTEVLSELYQAGAYV
jgi:hypothetical protein